MTPSLQATIDTLLAQGATVDEIIAMLEPRANSTASSEVLDEVREYIGIDVTV